MRIAIVGTGVSGLVVAHNVHHAHDVTLFEADDRIGGHVHTWDISIDGGSYAIDSGFIVYNERNYPNFSRLLTELGVATQPSTMSFSVRADQDGLEYNGTTLNQLFVQRRNALRPSFLRMLADVLRFNREATLRVAAAHEPLGTFLERGGYSRAFREWYLLPMGSAIRSMPLSDVLGMPASFFVRFFENHGMLSVNNRPQWRVVCGGSARYVEALIAPFHHRIRVNEPVRRIIRLADRVEINGESFDQVVLACHSDQALALLADPTDAERAILGAMPYLANDAVLHTDVSLLPRARRAWAAWNYRIGSDPIAPAALTYNMSMLQSIDATETFCVTLNGTDQIDPARIIGRVGYLHPWFTVAGAAAQARHDEISGINRTHYCGAYWGNGFHEDGVVSGMAVAREIEIAAAAALAGAGA